MKLVITSDTHNRIPEDIPDGDVFIHAGDLTGSGTCEEINIGLHWIKRLPHKHKIIIAGNHDWWFYNNSDMTHEICNAYGVTYLQDEALVIDGVKFYGSPWQPTFHNWAFNLSRGNALAEKWFYIHDDTDVLITHCPPFGVLDECDHGKVGCKDLLARICNLSLQLHIFGHIHEGYGKKREIWKDFINASHCKGPWIKGENPVVTYEIGE